MIDLHLDHVSYQYSGQEGYALRDINLHLCQGEYVAVTGKTGSGKSTLLQLMNGLLVPSEGNVWLNGENVHQKSFPICNMRQKIALCFQYPEYQLFEETVLKDICFGPMNMGLSKEDAEKKAREAMRMLGLPEEIEHTSPFNLSGGQKRRVALAGILAMEPECLILDEPTAGLDERGRELLFSQLRNLHETKKTTIVLVTHNMDDAAAQANRLLVLKDGALVIDGKTETVLMDLENIRAAGLTLPQSLGFYDRLRERITWSETEERLPLTVEMLARQIAVQCKKREVSKI